MLPVTLFCVTGRLKLTTTCVVRLTPTPVGVAPTTSRETRAFIKVSITHRRSE